MHYTSIEAMPKGSGQTIDIEKDQSNDIVKAVVTAFVVMSKWFKRIAAAATVVVFVGAVLGYLWDVFRYDPVEPVRPAVKAALAKAEAKKASQGALPPAAVHAQAPAPSPSVAQAATAKRMIQAGQWTEFPVERNLRIVTQPGIPFTAKVNDDPHEYQSGPNGELVNLPSTIFVRKILIKPAQDMEVELIPRN